MALKNKVFSAAMAAVFLTLPTTFEVMPAQAEEIILGHVMNKEHIFHHVSQRFMKRLDELSGGTMKVDYHPGGDIGDWTSIVGQVAQGAVPFILPGSSAPVWGLATSRRLVHRCSIWRVT